MKNCIILAMALLLAQGAWQEGRAQNNATAKRPTQGGRVPEGVKAHRDMPYVENGHERQKLDLYVPEKSDGPLPVIIWVHGGGWQNGSKASCPPLREGYVQKGYAVASLGYRLSSHAIFPAQIQDCKAGIRWLRAHAKEYNLDPERFAVWGSSAGGHLVALIGTSGDVKDFDVGPNLKFSSRVQAVCDFYGPTDLVKFVQTPGYERHATADSPEAKLIGGAILENKEKAQKANPIAYVSKDDPPFLIVYGDKDGTVAPNQNELLFEALKKEGLSVHLHTIHGAGHGGPGFTTPEVQKLVTEFFEKKLKHKPGKDEKVVADKSESTAPEGSDRPRVRNNSNGQNTQGRRAIPFRAILNREDANKDGKVTKDEFKGPPQLFQRWDLNKDGVLTQEEYEKATGAGMEQKRQQEK